MLEKCREQVNAVHFASESEGSNHDSGCEKHLREAGESAQVENCGLGILSLVARCSLVEGVRGIIDFDLLLDSMACSLRNLECSRPLPDDGAVFTFAGDLTVLGVDQVVVRSDC